MEYQLMKLETLVKAYNIDRTENKKGTIKSYVNLKFSLNGKNFKERFYVQKNIHEPQMIHYHVVWGHSRLQH